LHFHERDLARGLIVFSKFDDQILIDKEKCREILKSAVPFHYKSFTSIKEASNWYSENINNSCESIIQLAKNAKHPFQFIANVLAIEEGETDPLTIPVTQDASSSAYQIMSYLLLDESLAKQTNLIPSDNDKINDLYLEILTDLKQFLQQDEQFNTTIKNIICDNMNRKLVKAIFMPIIYGKTSISISNDIQKHYSNILTNKECYLLASLCLKYIKHRYPNIINLMKLIKNIGWLSSAENNPVYYSVPSFTTVQDYMVTKQAQIWIYDRLQKKIRKVTLRIPTLNRDRRKTEVATFANFIHQKDAFIAMNVVINLITYAYAPIYTVHDNFITTASYCELIPIIYIYVFKELKSPLELINILIDLNLIRPVLSNYMDIKDNE
jgi:DNA-directed RNA polymerase